MLTELTYSREITVLQIPGRSHIEGMAIANTLSKTGSITQGPVPQIPITDNLCRRTYNTWVQERITQRWRNTQQCEQAKLFVNTPDSKLTNSLLLLDKLRMSITTGILTGHVRLNYYLQKIGVRDDPDCNFCGGGHERALHFLCECPHYSQTRKAIYGKDFLTPNEVMMADTRKISSFVLSSGRFQNLGNRLFSSHTSLGRGDGSVTVDVARSNRQSSSH